MVKGKYTIRLQGILNNSAFIDISSFRSIMLLAGCMLIASLLPAQVITYTNCNQCWNADSLGNHRAVVVYNGKGKAADVTIAWRRRDENPQLKRIIVQDSATGQKINNVQVLSCTREAGHLVFEPVSGKGSYYVYYLPYRNEGRSNYPKGVYLKPEMTASAEWLQSFTGSFLEPNTVCREIQSIDAFNSLYPMEVIATQQELKKITDAHAGKSFIVFPENRAYPVKMVTDIPQRWAIRGAQTIFTGTADKGEYYAFQLGVYALKDISGVTIKFTGLRSADGKSIPASAINCLNTAGIGYDAKPFTKTVTVAAHTVQPFWCGISIPEKILPGVYHGKAMIQTDTDPAQTVALEIKVTNAIALNGGENEPEKQTRLKWLNSTLAQENTLIAPYTALQLTNQTISLLGRKLELTNDGFPKQIQTFFTEEMTAYSEKGKDLLDKPVHVTCIKKEDGQELFFNSKGIQFTKLSDGTIQWQAISQNDFLQMTVAASLEFDGFLSYTVKITALQNIELKDIRMEIPFVKTAAKYMMGLGQKGGYRKDHFEWQWDVAKKNQDGAWIGDVNGGLQYSLRDEKYIRPLNTNFYLQKPLLLPASWGNNNKGGITISEQGNTALVKNYSGPRSMQKGETLYYNFNLLITPFHTINTDFQWATKFYHQYNTIDSILKTGATVINIHHATPINPWINYPFIEWRKMKVYISEAHAKGLKVKIYNTVRELSNHAYELPALNSLGHEVYTSGKGGGFSWLQEHVGDDYIPAWFVPEIKDAALVNSGMNRWHNYYVEGMNWLVKNVGIDGIYLDDVAFDRITMKRIKRVLTNDGHPGIIDLHSANQYNKNDGFNNSANLYLEHFPYLNRLWFGEYFDYENNPPDFFLTEVSGIPFGLMGEMLQNGGNPWRGMVYGMTNRMPWSDNADPRALWKLWDAFGMMGSQMIGYWSSNCPITTGDAKVLATVYSKPHAALVSIASWEAADTTIQLLINWKKLGLNQAKTVMVAPEIKGLQAFKQLSVNDRLPVGKNKGILLLLTEKE